MKELDLGQAASFAMGEWQRDCVCTHEAGHVVACIRYGIQFEKATCVPDGDTQGSVSIMRDPVVVDRIVQRLTKSQYIVALLAGYAAQIENGQHEENAMIGSGPDFETVRVLIRDCPETLESWKEKARAFCRRQAPAIKAIEAALIEHGTLTYQEAIDRIPLGPTEDLSESDFKESTLRGI